MLHHISLSADNPLRVAQVLAEIFNCRLFPFPPYPGSYIVVMDDQFGTAIEVLPSGTELAPGSEEAEYLHNASPAKFTTVHAALSVPLSQEQIEEIGHREGWKVRVCDRGPFHVVELWLENQFLLELLPPSFAAQYLEFMEPQNLEAFMTQSVA